MTRIIPWTLPEVKGGSIGGYTERGGGSGGDDEDPVTVQHFDLTDLAFSTSSDSIYTISANKTVAKNATVDVKSLITGANLYISGLQALDLTGVASCMLLITSEVQLPRGNLVFNTVGRFAVDLATLAVSYSSIDSATITNLSTSSSGTASNVGIYLEGQANSLSVKLFAYNGNGEIIETLEKVIV